MKNSVKKVLLFCLAMGLCSALYAAGAQAADFSQAQLKQMSTFLSNFTELGFRDFDVKKDGNDDVLHLGGDPSAPDLIRFGIWHNYVNNYKSRIKPCPTKGCKYGSLVIDGKYVAESVKKYFGINLKNASVEQSDPPYHFDGSLYHFEGADGEAVYYAEVKKATQDGDVVRMTGDLYNAEDKNDRPATFEATARPCKWNGKDTWMILSMKTTQR
ncbi:MAG: hypothetical protein J5838_00925 [Desulfovibrio sp.]|nr:hypothetical protein [Desulfovibrio sp.]